MAVIANKLAVTDLAVNPERSFLGFFIEELGFRLQLFDPGERFLSFL